MKRYFFILSILFGLLALPVFAQTAKQKVAVYVTGDIDSGYKKVIGSKLVTGITRSEGYVAVERTADFLAELAKEQDYQMSGAVRDNQIARLGQQFGVSYVLVADISEVFESMFISARMIDVQTAQITKSTESDAVVDNMESLTKITENIVLPLFYAKEYARDEIKVLGPFSTVSDLVNCNIPNNYRIATQDEIEKIITNNQILNIKTYLPIYTDICSTGILENQYFSWCKGKAVSTESRPYIKSQCSFTLIKDIDSVLTLQSSYIRDTHFSDNYNTWNDDGYSTRGLDDMSSNPSITKGYVYLIKEE